MELEFSRVINAPAERLWSVLLDPDAMAKCVPGMKSVEVISDTEYRARIHVKIAFISAKFDVRTVITEMTPPSFLRSETSGEDNSVGSAVKSVSEIFLTPVDDGTELRVTAKATVLGRLGTLGLNPMRTKAERMWNQFCNHLEAHLSDPSPDQPEAEAGASGAADAPASASPAKPETGIPQAHGEAGEAGRNAGFLPRLRHWIGGTETIRVEFARNGASVVLHWPASKADQCLAWLDRQFEPKDGA